MAGKLDTPSSEGLIVKSGTTVLVDDAGRVFDELPCPCSTSTPGALRVTGRPTVCREAAISPRHGQDVVIDPAGVAYSVRLHLAQHLHVSQRVARLEATIAGLHERANQQQTFMSDLRREKYVTRGAFMAAQLCKADRGELAVQRGKLDLVCSLLVSAGVLDQGVGGEFSVSRYEFKQSEVADQAVKQVALEEKVEENIARVESAAKEARDEGKRAVLAAAEASRAAEKVAAQCRQLERECAAAGARSSSALEEGMDEGSRRIQANSTRIFELSAEVERLERLAESNRNSLELVATTPSTNREGKTEYCPVEEVADLTPREQRLEVSVSTSPGLVTAPHPPQEEAPREGRGTPGVLTAKAERGDSEGQHEGVTTTVLVGGASEEERSPRRPGVLDAPGPQGCLEADHTRKYMTTSTSWSRRSTHTGRRRVFARKERVQAVDPVRPQVGRPCAEQATPNSWARASWPSLANEKGRSVRPERCCLTGKIDPKPDKKSLARECQTSSLTLSLAHDEQLRHQTGDEAGRGRGCATTRSDDPGVGVQDTGADHNDEPHTTNPHEESGSTPSASVAASTPHPRSTTSQKPIEPEYLATTTTVNEAEALLGALASGRRDSTSGGRGGLGGKLKPRRATEENISRDSEKVCGTAGSGGGGSTDFTSTERADSRGGRLAYLEGVPTLWHPRDTWELDAASASGSSSSAELN